MIRLKASDLKKLGMKPRGKIKSLKAFKEAERTFQKRVIAYAWLRGWAVAHFRTVAVRRPDGSFYHATPVSADGKGWPDLVLVRDKILFRELKKDGESMTVDQTIWDNRLTDAQADFRVWHPKDWDHIVEELE